MIKRIFTQSRQVLVLNYIGRLLSALNTFVLLPAFLTMSQLGLYGGIHNIVFLLAKFDLGQSLIRYGAGLHKDKEGRAELLGGVWLLTTLGYGILMGLLFLFRGWFIGFFAPKAPEVLGYFPLIIVLGYTVLLSVTLKGWYIAMGRVGWPSFTQHVVMHVLIIGWLVLYGLGKISFTQLLIGTLVPYATNVLLLVVDLWRRGLLRMQLSRRFFNADFLSSFLAYSFFTFLMSSMAMLMIRCDNIMVMGMCGKEAEGMYHTVAFMALLLEIPMKVVKQTRAAQLVRLLQGGGGMELRRLYKSVTQWQFALSSFIFVLFYINLDYILYAFDRQAVVVMRRLFLLLGVGKLIDNLFRMGSEVLLLSRYFAWSIIGVLLLPLGIFANYRLISLLGIYGAPIATGMVLLLGGGMSCLVIWRKLHVHPWSWQLMGWIAATSLTIGCSALLPDGVMGAGAGTVVACVIFLGTSYGIQLIGRKNKPVSHST